MGTSTWNEPGYSAGGIWACLALLLPFSGTALAQDRTSPHPLRIELNRIEAAGEDCRTYFLIDNQKGESWRSIFSHSIRTASRPEGLPSRWVRSPAARPSSSSSIFRA
jgi:hypothetical protein